LSALGLVCLVVADRATGGSADKTMMTGKMPRGASHQCALDASFGLGWCCYGEKRDRNRGAPKNLIHLLLLGNRSRTPIAAKNSRPPQKVPNECLAKQTATG
jgi:hypothetical protein